MEHDHEQTDARGGITDSRSIVCHQQGTTGTVVISGDLDLIAGDKVEAAVAELVSNGATDISIQAEAVTFIDSSGIGGLLAARAKVLEANGTFHLSPTPDPVSRVIQIAGLTDLLTPNPHPT